MKKHRSFAVKNPGPWGAHVKQTGFHVKRNIPTRKGIGPAAARTPGPAAAPGGGPRRRPSNGPQQRPSSGPGARGRWPRAGVRPAARRGAVRCGAVRCGAVRCGARVLRRRSCRPVFIITTAGLLRSSLLVPL